MQEHKYWEESFRVYEKGTALFKYPHVRDIWLAYLQQFVSRYGGAKLERARDLFKQALSQARALPPRPNPIHRSFLVHKERALQGWHHSFMPAC
jgi:pre-mRNA-splicing factor SYF1